MFCPKCGALVMPKAVKGKRTLACTRCKWVNKDDEIETTVREEVEQEKEVEVVDSNQELDALPIVDVECPQCKNEKAHFWTVQTRASDEPETKFYRCTKCKHTWRDYS